MAGTRAIIHVDMDAFYASVEQRDRPELKGQPVIVGGHPRRGVVLAASYEVRRFGVRSAIPMAQALKLAPTAVVVAPRFDAYVEASEAVFRIFEAFTPLVEPLSLDEAFLDVTGSVALFGDPAAIARTVRARIRGELGLPASAGIAEVKFVAKVASDLAKPDGQREVPVGTAREFLRPLPVSRLWGVGPRTEETLLALGLKTVGDVADRPQAWLQARLGNLGLHLWRLAHAIDERVVVPDGAAKSIGAQDTFDADVGRVETLYPHIHSQALRVGRRLRKAGMRTRAVQLTVKLEDFTVYTRQTTLAEPTDDGQVLYREAVALLDRVPLDRRVRLTGVSAHELLGTAPQLTLFEAPPRKADKLNAALDGIAARFGNRAVVTADLAEDDVFAPRDGFYREQKQELASRAEQQRVEADDRVEREPGEEG